MIFPNQTQHLQRRYIFIGLLLMIVLFLATTAGVLRSKIETIEHLYQYSGVHGVKETLLHISLPWSGPSVEWQVSLPEAHGLSRQALVEFTDGLSEHYTDGVLVVQGGEIVHEWYTNRYDVNEKQSIAGVTKGATISMALMLALEDGLISLDDPAYKYIPAWESDPVRSRITIRQLATHSSGIENVLWGRGLALTGWQRQFEDDRQARFPMAVEGTPIIFSPGTSYHYSSVAYYPLAYAITKSLQDAPETDILSLLEHRIMAPMDVPLNAWSISYGESYHMDGLKLYSVGGGKYTARALARVGQLMLNRGEWEGEQLVSSEWVDTMVAYGGSPTGRVMADTEPASGLGWQINHDGFFPSLPKDAYITVGANHELLLVVPSLDLVFVRMGEPLIDPPSYPEPLFWQELDEFVFAPLMQAMSQK